jgi:threonine dehydratase
VFEDVADAAARIAGQAYRTPLLHAGGELAAAARSVVVKAENLQIGGSFKFRGAYNRLAQLDAAQRARGVVAWSSGNHAQGVAAAGRRLGVATTIVMPRDAPRTKIDGTAQLGAEIVFYDRYTENREAIARALAGERGATLVPSYDDPDVIAGQGTVGLEIIEQSQRLLGSTPGVLLVPCGGGGLVAGCAIAFERLSPRTRIYCVEPAGFDDTARSLASGRREHALEGSRTVCDALMAPTPGELTWPINRRLLAGGISVTDAMVTAAVAYAWREMKLVLEPGGAVAIAALLHGLLDCRNQRVAVVASGGNVDVQWYRDALGTISGHQP